MFAAAVAAALVGSPEIFHIIVEYMVVIIETPLEVESYNNNKANYEKNIRYFWDSCFKNSADLL
jgi:hypothetical protein